MQEGSPRKPLQDDSPQVNIHDLATMPRRSLQDKPGVEFSRHVGPLNLERAIVERWRDGLEVTAADRLLSGSALVLAGDVLFEIAGERPVPLTPGSYFELPEPDTSFRARCASEECLILSGCDSIACSVADQAKGSW
jgi:hypothetical protein